MGTLMANPAPLPPPLATLLTAPAAWLLALEAALAMLWLRLLSWLAMLAIAALAWLARAADEDEI